MNDQRDEEPESELSPLGAEMVAGLKKYLSTLERELATYQRLRPQLLLSNAGEFAVIDGDDLVGCRPDYESALRLGYERRGVGAPFLVKQVLDPEPVLYFTRPV
jgi:hypothetical protein